MSARKGVKSVPIRMLTNYNTASTDLGFNGLGVRFYHFGFVIFKVFEYYYYFDILRRLFDDQHQMNWAFNVHMSTTSHYH